MRKIGIMGGTFDPIHNGHLLLGCQAQSEYHLDQIWYMPSKNPPHKKDRFVTDASTRAAMVQLAIKNQSDFYYSDFELMRDGNTYTAQTVELLQKKYADDHFYWIIGADSLFEIESWYHPEVILSSVSLLVAKRFYKKADSSLEEQKRRLELTYDADIQLLHSDLIDISSADIRKQLQAGKSIASFVSADVAAYIKLHRLYE